MTVIMNRQYIIKSILASLLVIAASAGTALAQADSLDRKVPSAMFGVSPLTNTAAISTVEGDDLYHTPAVNVSNSLVGRLPGLTLNQGSGHPGMDDASWLIRGVGSHGFAGFNTAKIFIDGFEVNRSYFNSLSPSEIESVSILKDGAATTLFGDRGANGIIWVETKRGEAGPVRVSANVRSGLQMPTVIEKPLGSYDYAWHYNIAASNDAGAWSPVYDNAALTAYRDGNGIDTDWWGEAMRKNGYFVDGDVSMNGGNEWARYYVVLGYLDQQGLFNVRNDRDKTSNTDFQRFNVRANLDINIGKIFEAKVDLGGKLYNSSFPTDGVDGIMNSLTTYPNNIYNIYDDTDRTHWSGTQVYPNNPVAALKARGYRLEKDRILQANFTLKEKLDFITPGLYLSQAFSLNNATASSQNRTANYVRWFGGAPDQTTDRDEPILAGGYGSDGMQDWKQGEISAGYKRSWGKHSLDAVAGAHISAYKGDGYFSFKNNYLNYRGKVHYDYDGRYVAEVALSTFGNDGFAAENRWKVYPAVSGAWVISGEEFMKDSRTVDLLKLRASFGMSGSSDSEATANLSMFADANGRFLYKEYYTTANILGQFFTGASTPNGQSSLVPMFYPNRDAHSETSYKYNVGIDLKMWNGRFNLSADAFLDRRTDILTWDQTIMKYYGWNDAVLNIGEMTNRGFELAANWADRAGDWSYSLGGAVSFNRNKILESGEVPTTYDYNAYTGRPYGTAIGLVSDGLYGTEDFNSDGTLVDGIAVPLFGDVQPGDIKYRDIDGNGFVDNDDVTKIGNPVYPEWTYSFRAQVAYKGFDLDVLMQGTAGASVSLLTQFNERVVPFVGDKTIYKFADNAWAYYPDQNIDNRDGATYPRLTLEENLNNHRESSFWMRSLDYVKIRHIELGYTFKVDGMTNLRVYANAANPFTFSKLKRELGIDPENLNSYYPSLKSYTLGVSLSF